MNNEIWKPIPGYEGYEASTLGRIRSLSYDKTGRIKIMKPWIAATGYYTIMLTDNNGKRKTIGVHRLIYLTFFGSIPYGMHINHIDENKLNNNLNNLNLLTPRENYNWGTRNKRITKTMTNGKTSKKVYQYTLDGELVRVWPSTMECNRNGFNHSHIAECCRGVKPQYRGFIWSYSPLS